MPTPDPLTRAELEELLADLRAGRAGFDQGQKAVVEEVLQAALRYEEGAAKWARYRAQNKAANEKYRKSKGAKT